MKNTLPAVSELFLTPVCGSADFLCLNMKTFVTLTPALTSCKLTNTLQYLLGLYGDLSTLDQDRRKLHVLYVTGLGLA